MKFVTNTALLSLYIYSFKICTISIEIYCVTVIYYLECAMKLNATEWENQKKIDKFQQTIK